MKRRRYLKTLGATAGVVLSSAPTETAAPERREAGREPPLPVRPVRFDRVVDMVADAGCDPTGREDCSEALRRTARDGTLLEFPTGSYRVDETIRLLGLDDFGVRGTGGATFVAPPDKNGVWIVVDEGRGLLFENVDLDITAPNAAPTLKLGVTDGLVVRDVEVVGRGIRQGSRPRGEGGNVVVGGAFLPIVRSPRGTGIVERFVAKHGGRIGTYNGGDGRHGIFIGRSNRGTVRLVDCHLAEFPNNGVYASRTTGTVQVVGGTFENNDISQVRLGSEGSFLSNARVRVDVGRVSPPSDPADFLNPRGVWMEGADLGAGGVVVRDTEFAMGNSTRHPPGAIVVERTCGHFHVRNVRIRTRAGPAIAAKPPTGGTYAAPPRPHWGTIEDVDVRGRATEGSAIHLADRDGTKITDTTIDQPFGNRDGIRLVRSAGCSVSGGSIAAGRFPVLVTVSGEMDDDDCLVTIDGMDGIETTAEGGFIRAESRLVGPVSTRLRGCVTPRMITDEAHSNLVVSFTDSRFGQLYGVVHSG